MVAHYTEVNIYGATNVVVNNYRVELPVDDAISSSDNSPIGILV